MMGIKLALMKQAARRARKKVIADSKKAGAPTGERFVVPRTGEKGVETYLYRPKETEDKLLPVIFNVHGGAWVGNDALYLDTQSRQMAERLQALVVNINYTKADIKPFPYMQTETVDTVKYFAKHAAEYNIDRGKMGLMGYSAGGQICAAAAQMLKRDKVEISVQILCYPFLDFTYGNGTQKELAETVGAVGELKELFFPTLDKKDPTCSPGAQKVEDLIGLAPAIIVACGTDPLRVQAQAYGEKLREAGVPVWEYLYEKAVHGFLEVNYPESVEVNEAKNPEQEKLMEQCQEDIAERLREIWGLPMEETATV